MAEGSVCLPAPAGRWSGPWIVAAVVGLSSLAVTPLLSNYRGDEGFYTNAVLQMRDSGDLIVPRYSGGQERFAKPILTYWLILSSYALFGVNYAATRLPIVALSALSIGMVWLLGRRLLGQAAAATLGAAFLALNLNFFNPSARATPDIPQFFSVCLALVGWTGLLFHQPRRATDCYLLWCGIGLAIAAKGGLGLLLLLFVLAFTAWRAKATGVRVRDLLHPAALTLGLTLALFWFGLVIVTRGPDALLGLYRDQVGIRFEGSKLYILRNLFWYPIEVVASFLPLSLLILAAAWGRREAVGQWMSRHREALLLTACWTALLLAVFSLGNIYRPRYLLPAMALIAPLAASLLHELLTTDPARARAIEPHTRWPLAALAVIGAAELIGGLIHVRIALGGVVILLAAAAAGLLTRRADVVKRLTVLALLLFVLLRAHTVFVQEALFESPFPAAIAATRDQGRGSVVIVYGRGHEGGSGRRFRDSAQMRVLAGGELDVRVTIGEPGSRELEDRPILMYPLDNPAPPPDGYEFFRQVCGYESLEREHVAALLRQRSWSALRQAQRTGFVLARPVSTSGR